MPIISDPISQWKMNDNAASAIVADAMEVNNGAAQRNTDQLTTPGKINTALLFNGSSDYITVDDSPSLDVSQISIACWVKKDTTADGYIIARDNGGTDRHFWIYIVGNHIRWETWDTVDTRDTFADDTTPIGTSWRYIVATWNGTVKKIYVDGEEVKSKDVSGNLKTGTQPIYIGDNKAGVSMYFDGIIDDVRYYDFALSPGQVAGLYANGNGTEERNPSYGLGNALFFGSNF